jgi:plastocyanin
MKGWFTRFFAGVAAVAFLLSWAGLAEANTIVIDVKSNFFSPNDVSVVVGDTVRWVWDQGVHTTTSSDGLWDSGVLGVGSIFEYTFNNPGDFAYTCTLHFNCCNMAGTIHVKPPSATQLLVTAQASVTAGSPFDLTVTALDTNGNIVPSYAGTVTFTSSDPFPGVLPANYTFTPADQGTHTFSGGVTFFTGGSQTLTAQDTGASSISGTATIAVSAAPANHLFIAAPPTAVSGTPFDVMVAALDAYGNVDINYVGTVTWVTNDTDPGVILPADYAFLATDSGVHIFPGGVTLVRLGDQTLTATDTVSGIAGSAIVTVGPGP